ncbi:MAG TPA: pyruvate kinase, partial [Actinomycetota bacterium]|nr:pyruvate kinase [Actinomycetota bacterium]
MRRTKIVATLGPASHEPGVIDALIEEGADVLRLNFAHGDPTFHKETVARVRAAAERNERVVGILGDLPGPKMRTGPIAGGEVLLEAGQSFLLRSGYDTGDETACCTTVTGLDRLVATGEEIFLADGQIVLEVGAIESGTVHTQVVRGGVLRSGKGLHIPGAERKVDAFTARDEEALSTAVELGVDFIGLSFVRGKEDLERVREKLQSYEQVPALLAKIETRAAVENLDEIVSSADAVMVARGDLG